MKEKVDYLKIGGEPGDTTLGEFGWVFTRSGNLYYLWWTVGFPGETTAAHYRRRESWVAMLRDAMTHNLDVKFLTDSDSSGKVITIQLYAP